MGFRASQHLSSHSLHTMPQYSIIRWPESFTSGKNVVPLGKNVFLCILWTSFLRLYKRLVYFTVSSWYRLWAQSQLITAARRWKTSWKVRDHSTSSWIAWILSWQDGVTTWWASGVTVFTLQSWVRLWGKLTGKGILPGGIETSARIHRDWHAVNWHWSLVGFLNFNEI